MVKNPPSIRALTTGRALWSSDCHAERKSGRGGRLAGPWPRVRFTLGNGRLANTWTAGGDETSRFEPEVAVRDFYRRAASGEKIRAPSGSLPVGIRTAGGDGSQCPLSSRKRTWRKHRPMS